MKGARVLRFVLRPLGIFWCLSVPLRVYSQRLLVEVFFITHPPFAVLRLVWGYHMCPQKYQSYTITIQFFG